MYIYIYVESVLLTNTDPFIVILHRVVNKHQPFPPPKAVKRTPSYKYVYN